MPTAKPPAPTLSLKQKLAADPLLAVVLAYVLLFALACFVLVFWQIAANYRHPRLTILPKEVIEVALVCSAAQVIAVLKYLFRR